MQAQNWGSGYYSNGLLGIQMQLSTNFWSNRYLPGPSVHGPPQLQNGRVFFQASCPIRHALGLHLTCGQSIPRTIAACVAHHSFLQCRCYSCALVRLFPIVLITPQALDAPKTDHARPSASTPPQDLPRVPSFARRPVYIAYDTLLRVVMLDCNSSL